MCLQRAVEAEHGGGNSLMRKLGVIAVLSMLVVALAAVRALAQSGHFVTGGGNTPIASGPDDFGDLDLVGKGSWTWPHDIRDRGYR